MAAKKEPISFTDMFEFILSVTLGSNTVRQKESSGSAKKKRAEFAQRYGAGLHWSNVTSKGEWGIDHSCGDRSVLFSQCPEWRSISFVSPGPKFVGSARWFSAQGSVRQVHISQSVMVPHFNRER